MSAIFVVLLCANIIVEIVCLRLARRSNERTIARIREHTKLLEALNGARVRSTRDRPAFVTSGGEA